MSPSEHRIFTTREKHLNRNVRITYLINFMGSLLFYAPILALYLEEQLFTVFNVTIILSIVTFGTALLEVPSGAFADFFGRRRTIVLSSIISVVDVTLLATGTTLIHFIIYAAVAAVGLSLMSGTGESLLFDTLAELKRENTFKRIIGIHHAVSPIGHSVASIVGGLMATVSLRTPVIYSILPFVAALAASLFLIEPKYHRPASTNMLSHIKDSARELLSSRQLFLLVLAYFLFEAFGESIHQISQIFYAFNEIPVEYFGFIFAVVFGLSALGSLISHDVSEKVGEKRSLIISTLLSMLSIFAATCTRGWIAIAFLVSGSLFFGIRNPIMSHMTNLEIESSNRTTILSIRNLATSMGFALFVPVLGILADSKGIIAGYRFFAGMFLILIFVQFLLKERD